MDTYLFTVFFSFSALFCCVLSQSCEQAHYERCLKQLLQFTEKADLIFGATEEELQQQCVQAQSALGCLTRYSKKCLPLEERPKFTEGIGGPQKITLGLCTEDGNLRARYIDSLPCLKNASEGLQYCKEKYDRNQRDIILVEYEDKTHLQCCSFDGYRRCMRMVMDTQEQCRDGSADVIDEIASRLAGALSEDTCVNYFDRCTGGNTANLNAAVSMLLLILSPLVGFLFCKYQ